MRTRVCDEARTVPLPPLPEARTVTETATSYRIAGKGEDSKIKVSEFRGFKLWFSFQVARDSGYAALDLALVQSTLLPQESVSTLVGVSSTIVKEFSDTRFEAECRCKDSTGKTFRSTFICSVDANQKQLVHDHELPKTLRELQDIPKELARIAELLENFKPNS